MAENSLLGTQVTPWPSESREGNRGMSCPDIPSESCSNGSTSYLPPPIGTEAGHQSLTFNAKL